MILGHDLMVQLGLSADLKRQVLQSDGVIVLTKKPSVLLGKSELTIREMRVVVMQIQNYLLQERLLGDY